MWTWPFRMCPPSFSKTPASLSKTHPLTCLPPFVMSTEQEWQRCNGPLGETAACHWDSFHISVSSSKDSVGWKYHFLGQRLVLWLKVISSVYLHQFCSSVKFDIGYYQLNFNIFLGKQKLIIKFTIDHDLFLFHLDFSVAWVMTSSCEESYRHRMV